MQIDTDGITVWVNDEQGSCIGRFGRQGIDIHRSPAEQLDDKGECLHCTHGPTTVEHWREFQQKMQEFYQLELSDCFLPDRFRVI